jgi:hypothetical protein
MSRGVRWKTLSLGPLSDKENYGSLYGNLSGIKPPQVRATKRPKALISRQLHRLALVFEVQNLIALGQILLIESDRLDRFGPTRNFGLAQPQKTPRLARRSAA